MATSNDVMTKGYNPSANITKYRAVKITAAETVTPLAASTDVAIGVAQNTVLLTDFTDRGIGAQVRVMGASMMEASAAIAVGALVTCAADGRAKTGAAGERVIGICVEAASGAGKYARVQLTVPGFLHP